MAKNGGLQGVTPGKNPNFLGNQSDSLHKIKKSENSGNFRKFSKIFKSDKIEKSRSNHDFSEKFVIFRQKS